MELHYIVKSKRDKKNIYHLQNHLKNCGFIQVIILWLGEGDCQQNRGLRYASLLPVSVSTEGERTVDAVTRGDPETGR